MNKKIIIIVGIIAITVIVAFSVSRNSVLENDIVQNNVQNQETENNADDKEDLAENIILGDGDNIMAGVTSDKIVDLTGNSGSIKEIAMTSFTEIVDGKYKPQFSKKEIIVNNGDKVRIKITVTGGAHDFKIDEFDVYADTKELNQEYIVEFIADKSGEFTYYCSKPGHRQNGHLGTLKVL